VDHLLPPDWFLTQSQWVLLAVAALAMVVLLRGADLLVDGAAGLAARFGVPEVIIGATVVSLGTTSPEAAVSVMAAWSGEPGLALGNAIGSIVADTGLIFGLGCMLAVIPAKSKVLSRQGWIQFSAAAALAVFCYGAAYFQGEEATLGRPVGVLLLMGLIAYIVCTIRWGRSGAEEEPVASDRGLTVLIAMGIGGLAMVLVASRVMVLSMIVLAEVHWQVPSVVVAATLVAFGTSLPELAIGITCVLRGKTELLVGNVIGADILNVLFVVGASAVAAPLPILDPSAEIPDILLIVHVPAMLLILALFRLFILRATRQGNFRRWYGVPLVVCYVLYVVVQYVIS